MEHEENTKIWAKIISTRALNAATKPTTLEKSWYSPQSKLSSAQLLETPVSCDMAKHAARENNLAAGSTNVKEFIFLQTSAEAWEIPSCG